jgi:hypothetical protein
MKADAVQIADRVYWVGVLDGSYGHTTDIRCTARRITHISSSVRIARLL